MAEVNQRRLARVFAAIRQWFRPDAVVELDVHPQPSSWRVYRVRANTTQAAIDRVGDLGHVDGEKGTCIHVEAYMQSSDVWEVWCQYSHFPLYSYREAPWPK